MTDLHWTKPLAALALVALLAGCSTFNPSRIVPGTSTAGDVTANMGEPAEKLAEASGDSVWFYPWGRLGRQTWAIRVGADGTVRSVEQRLTEANIKRIEPGKTTIKEVRELMGPPWYSTYYPQRQLHTWTYPMFPGPIMDWMVLWVDFDDAGVVRSAIYTRDPEQNTYSTDSGKSG